MEQKRTLWILIAAGVFLCVVFGAAFMMSRSATNGKNSTTAISMKDSDSMWIAPTVDTKSESPKADTKPAQESNVEASGDLASNQTASVEPSTNDTTLVSGESSLTKGLDHPEEASGPSIIQTENLSVIANGTTNIYQTESSSKSVSSNGIETTTFDFSSGSSSSTAVTAQNKAAEKAMKNADSKRGELAKSLDESTMLSSTKSVEPKKTTSTTTTSAKSTSTTTKSTASTSTAKTESKPATTTKPVEKSVESSRLPDRYWVQAASYSSKKKADEARAILDENKVQCEVFTFEMDGKLYYRVRVGPYTTKTEATYWKKQVDALDQFADAGTYIVNSSAPIAKK